MAQIPQRRTRMCGRCGTPGHNARTCCYDPNAEKRFRSLLPESMYIPSPLANNRYNKKLIDLMNAISQTNQIVQGSYKELFELLDVQEKNIKVLEQLITNLEESNIEETHREPLPVLTETVFDETDCPICITTLGDTNKSILRCGHPICMNCLMTQTLRAVATKQTEKCICGVCREPYM